MPKYYESGIQQWSQDERERRMITSPHFVWPKHRRVWVEQHLVDPSKWEQRNVGDVLTIGEQRACVLAHDWRRHRYLVAPDSPTVGLSVLARVLGRILRRANSGLMGWLWRNDLMAAPENVMLQWSNLRFPWRHEAKV